MLQVNPQLNYLTADNGCTIIHASSERVEGPAQNILTSVEKKIWLTNETPPQQCVISLKNMGRKPQYFNMIGFYCWHQMDTNPAYIEVFRRDHPGQWIVVSKIRLEKNDGWQNFRISQLEAEAIKELKIRIVQNFGGDKLYLNQVALYCIKNQQNGSKKSRALEDHENLYEIPKSYSGQKGSVEMNKFAATQKQLKRANEKIKALSDNQVKMQGVIERHERTIVKLQQNLRVVLGTVEKLYKMQEMRLKGQSLETSHKNKKPFSKEKERQSRRKQQKHEIIDMDSENQMSQYSNTNFQTLQGFSKTRPQQKKQLLDKLQRLLTLKEQKKSQLRSHQNSRTQRQRYEEEYYEDEESDDEGY